MFHIFGKPGKNKRLDALIQKIEMNVANNYKDAAQSGLKELEEELGKLKNAGGINDKQSAYYEERLAMFQKQMKNFTHKDQKPTWV